MKNYFLSFLLAVLVVLTGVTLRHSVTSATASGSASESSLVAIGGTPAPPIPRAIGGTPAPPIPRAIGGTPAPPIPKR